ncbi:helix-turn-helix transcriptional regulator [Halomonas alkaliantarctica]|uniref:Helix-turn-helix transcriptional regulator n=1 Tax=Halomonas alkaliantarctica TaxID=232346 RepID=A0ABY8LH43_9GAMM|nr:helix-turn-helix transcriptional regulator [Halomonas alkaliantarctica]WGI23660.1 helix-turn-helix transcriptional regulator [Halomonas alkaliantarctica]
MPTSTPEEFEFNGFRCRFGQRNSEWPSLVQAQVIACLAAGMTRKEIAKLRGCSPSTVSSTVDSLFYYLNTHRAAGAVAEAMRRGWIAPLLIALLVSGINPDTEAMRNRPPARTRQQVSASRNVSRRDVGSVCS